MVGRTDPSNSDNQNGDVGVSVCASSVCVCTGLSVRACVRDVFAIYDNNILSRLIMIIKIIILYFIEIAHTDDFPSTGTHPVFIMLLFWDQYLSRCLLILRAINLTLLIAR